MGPLRQQPCPESSKEVGMELNSIGTAVVMAYRGDGWCVRFRLLDLVAKRHSLARRPRLACYLPGDASNVAWPEKPTGEQDVRNAEQRSQSGKGPAIQDSVANRTLGPAAHRQRLQVKTVGTNLPRRCHRAMISSRGCGRFVTRDHCRGGRTIVSLGRRLVSWPAL